MCPQCADYFSSESNMQLVLGNSVQLTDESGVIEIVLYDQYADRSAFGEAANVERIIGEQLTAAGRTGSVTRLTDYAVLDATLTDDVDVLVLAEQESGFSAPWSTISEAWAPTLAAFIGRGGVVITTNYFDNGWQIHDHPSLVDIGSIGTSSNPISVVPVEEGHPIVAGVSSYAGRSGTSSWTGVASTAEAPSVITEVLVDSAARPVVIEVAF